jgi:hypothetical protein
MDLRIKLDGFRAIGVKTSGECRLHSRNKKEFNAKYPAIGKALGAASAPRWWRKAGFERMEVNLRRGRHLSVFGACLRQGGQDFWVRRKPLTSL